MSEPSPRIKATIIKVPDATPGLLFVNGQQKQFLVDSTWKSPVAPAANMAVDVELDATGTITGITAVDPNQANKERMAQMSKEAQEKGKEAAKLAQQGIGALAAKMGLCRWARRCWCGLLGFSCQRREYRADLWDRFRLRSGICWG